MQNFKEKITVNPKVCGGKPVIKGTRIPIYIIIMMLRDGASFEYIIECYPDLTEEDIQAVWDYMIHLVNPDGEGIPSLTQKT